MRAPSSSSAARRLLRSALALAAAGLVAGAPDLAGQSIEGRVLERGTRVPVANATVELRTATGEPIAAVVADESGAFVLPRLAPGSVRLRAERIGFAPAETRAFALEPRILLEVELLLDLRPVALEPLVVTRRLPQDRQHAGFHRRAELRGTSTRGYYLTRAEIQREMPPSTTALLDRVPGVRVIDLLPPVVPLARKELQMTGRGRPCSPRFYLDGVVFPVQDVDPDLLRSPGELEGVEIYQNPHDAPAEYQDPNGCGTVMLWTRGAEDRRAGGWKRHAIGTAALVGFLLSLAL
jgi:hypothetical protein